MPTHKKKKNKRKQKPTKKLPMVSAVEETLDGGQPEGASLSESVFLHDPGNGLHVKDVKNFLQSSFAQPISEEEIKVFGGNMIIEKLKNLLPEDIALVCNHLLIFKNTVLISMKILWYNKSRAKSVRGLPSRLPLIHTSAHPTVTRSALS